MQVDETSPHRAMQNLTIKRLSLGSIFKLTLIGLVVGLLPLMIVFGIMGVFGMETVKWEDEPVTGPAALIAAPLIGLLIAVIFTILLSPVMWLGQWLYAKYKSVTIRYEE